MWPKLRSPVVAPRSIWDSFEISVAGHQTLANIAAAGAVDRELEGDRGGWGGGPLKGPLKGPLEGGKLKKKSGILDF